MSAISRAQQARTAPIRWRRLAGRHRASADAVIRAAVAASGPDRDELRKLAIIELESSLYHAARARDWCHTAALKHSQEGRAIVDTLLKATAEH